MKHLVLQYYYFFHIFLQPTHRIKAQSYYNILSFYYISLEPIDREKIK